MFIPRLKCQPYLDLNLSTHAEKETAAISNTDCFLCFNSTVSYTYLRGCSLQSIRSILIS